MCVDPKILGWMVSNVVAFPRVRRRRPSPGTRVPPRWRAWRPALRGGQHVCTLPWNARRRNGRWAGVSPPLCRGRRPHHGQRCHPDVWAVGRWRSRCCPAAPPSLGPALAGVWRRRRTTGGWSDCCRTCSGSRQRRTATRSPLGQPRPATLGELPQNPLTVYFILCFIYCISFVFLGVDLMFVCFLVHTCAVPKSLSSQVSRLFLESIECFPVVNSFIHKTREHGDVCQ